MFCDLFKYFVSSFSKGDRPQSLCNTNAERTPVGTAVRGIQSWVKVAAAVILSIVIEAALAAPEKSLWPVPVQLLKLWPVVCAVIVQVRATERTSHKASLIIAFSV